MMKLCLSAVAVIVGATPVLAGETDRLGSDRDVQAVISAADAWLETKLARDGVVGASVAIVHDQEVVWSRGYGFANLATSEPATSETRYAVCSLSKIFTSLAAMRERDAGRLDIDAPISRHLPELTGGKSVIGNVSARSIMSHVSGLPSEFGLSYWTERQFPDWNKALHHLPGSSDIHPPFESFDYSNLGLTLLGQVVARSSGNSFADYVETEILQPLNMDATTTDIPTDLYGVELAVPYSARRTSWQREPIPAYRINALAPAAGFTSTTSDLARFASWQFRLLAAEESEILKPSTLKETHRVHWMSPDEPNSIWGLGFDVMQHDGKTFVGHEGQCPGYRSSLILRPQDQVAVIVLTNVDDLEPEPISFELYDLIAPEILAAVNPEKEQARTKDFSFAVGRYGLKRHAMDMLFFQVGDEIRSVFPFQTEDVASAMQRWRHVEGGTFEQIRDGRGRPKVIRFEVDETGRAVELWADNQMFKRME